MIDLHSHILRGIDDGARTLEDSLDIARSAVADGITVIAGTPHVRDDWPTDAGVMEYRVAELRAELQSAGIALDVRTGGEIAVEWLTKLPVEELRRFGLGGTRATCWSRCRTTAGRSDCRTCSSRLRAQGFTPVLAHPERNAEVQAHPERLVQLVESGVLVQITAASVDGRIGKRAQECGLRLIQRRARAPARQRCPPRVGPRRSGWRRRRRRSAAVRSAAG